MDNLNTLSVFAWGKAGGGKSRFVYSAACNPITSPVLALDLAGNPVSIRDYPQDQIKIIKITDLKMIDEAVGWIRTGQELKSPFAKKYGVTQKVKSFIFDGITEYSRRVLDKMGNRDTSFGFGNVVTSVDKINSIVDYNILINQLAQAAYVLSEIGIHIFVTALEREEQDIIYPDLIGRSVGKVPSYFGLVGRMSSIRGYTVDQREALTASGLNVKETKNFYMQIEKTPKVQEVRNIYSASEKAIVYVSDPTVSKLLEICSIKE